MNKLLTNVLNKALIIVIIGILNVQLVDAQSFKAYVKAGDKAMAIGSYNTALAHYSKALGKKPDDLAVSFKYAEVARMFFAYELAETYYKRVAANDEKSKFPLAIYQLAEVKRLQGKYGEAISMYEDFLKSNPVGEHTKEAKAQIAICKWAEEQVQNPVLAKVDQLNKRVNTPYSEFAPMLAGDTLYYASLRYDNKKDEHEPPRKVSKVLHSIKGRRGRLMSRGFNLSEKHNAHVVYDKSGKQVYYTICEYVGEVKINCAIYYREKDKRRRWKKPQKLPEPINLPGFTTTQPNIGYDEQGREYLFFASDRPGGKGGLDIWYSTRSGLATFSAPQNLKALNTSADDATPFFHTPSQSLFFSSQGHRGMGGYDIFRSRRLGEQWGEVEHLGYPLNSSYNDVYFIVNQDSTAAYLSSNRLGSFYLDKENKACCNDIYKVTFLSDTSTVPPSPDSLVVTIEPPDTSVHEQPEIVIELPEPEPTTLEEFLPLALYFDNDEPDKRTRRTTTKKSYSDTYQSYYARKPQYLSVYTAPLEEEQKWEAEEELDDFFENKVRRGYEHLNLFSSILLKRLNQGEIIEIFIKGFTSPRAKSDYNLRLGKRRVSSVRNHFDRYADKVFEPFLQSKQLIISERSFGETTASTGISDDLQDERNSIYSVAASVERRVEIVEIMRSR